MSIDIVFQDHVFLFGTRNINASTTDFLQEQSGVDNLIDTDSCVEDPSSCTNIPSVIPYIVHDVLQTHVLLSNTTINVSSELKTNLSTNCTTYMFYAKKNT